MPPRQQLIGPSSSRSRFIVGAGTLSCVALALAALLGVGNAAASVTAPGRPTGVAVKAGVTSATVRWHAPVANGGAPVTAYVVTPFLNGTTALPSQVFPSPKLSQRVDGLAFGKIYTFTVSARNVAGTGPKSLPSSRVRIGLPSAPRSVVAMPGNTTATVSWTAPEQTGGSAITRFTITPYQAGRPLTKRSTHTITGLINSRSYRFKVVLRNAYGEGAESPLTDPIVVGAPTAPTSVHAISGSGSARLTWSASVANGLHLLRYSVVPKLNHVDQPPQTFGASATAGRVKGLTNGRAYKFRVTATNSRGTTFSKTTSEIVIGFPVAPTNLQLAEDCDGDACNPVTGYWTAPTPTDFPITYVVTVVGDVHETFHTTSTSAQLYSDFSPACFAFTVAAVGPNGPGPKASSASSCVHPVGW